MGFTLGRCVGETVGRDTDGPEVGGTVGTTLGLSVGASDGWETDGPQWQQKIIKKNIKHPHRKKKFP